VSRREEGGTSLYSVDRRPGSNRVSLRMIPVSGFKLGSSGRQVDAIDDMFLPENVWKRVKKIPYNMERSLIRTGWPSLRKVQKKHQLRFRLLSD
jgi:hypothetical protein